MTTDRYIESRTNVFSFIAFVAIGILLLVTVPVIGIIWFVWGFVGQ